MTVRPSRSSVANPEISEPNPFHGEVFRRISTMIPGPFTPPSLQSKNESGIRLGVEVAENTYHRREPSTSELQHEYLPSLVSPRSVDLLTSQRFGENTLQKFSHVSGLDHEITPNSPGSDPQAQSRTHEREPLEVIIKRALRSPSPGCKDVGLEVALVDGGPNQQNSDLDECDGQGSALLDEEVEQDKARMHWLDAHPENEESGELPSPISDLIESDEEENIPARSAIAEAEIEQGLPIDRQLSRYQPAFQTLVSNTKARKSTGSSTRNSAEMLNAPRLSYKENMADHSTVPTSDEIKKSRRRAMHGSVTLSVSPEMLAELRSVRQEHHIMDPNSTEAMYQSHIHPANRTKSKVSLSSVFKNHPDEDRGTQYERTSGTIIGGKSRSIGTPLRYAFKDHSDGDHDIQIQQDFVDHYEAGSLPNETPPSPSLPTSTPGSHYLRPSTLSPTNRLSVTSSNYSQDTVSSTPEPHPSTDPFDSPETSSTAETSTFTTPSSRTAQSSSPRMSIRQRINKRFSRNFSSPSKVSSRQRPNSMDPASISGEVKKGLRKLFR